MDLHHVKSLLCDGRPLHHKQFYRLRLRCLGHPVLRLTVGGLQLALELSDPPRHHGLSSMLLPEETGLAARHLLQTLQSKKQAC